MNSVRPPIPLLIIALAVLLFIPFAGRVHLFDWDEINFAESAREMIISGDYLTVQIDFRPFHEKPPLFIWLQALSMWVFGINEFAARFPNAIAGVITLLMLYYFGRKRRNMRFGILWTAMYISSFLSHFYFRTGIIDPWFNLFMFAGILGMVQWFEWKQENARWLWRTISAFMIGLAVLTKGFVGLLIPSLVAAIYLLQMRFRLTIPWKKDAVYFLLIVLLVGGFWFGLQLFAGHGTTVREFLIYQVRLFSTPDAGHGGFFLYHFIIVMIGLFPASVLVVPALRPNWPEINEDPILHRWMVNLFWTVMIVFSIVRTKIVHYSSLSYFPITFLAASVVDRYARKGMNMPRWQSRLLFFIAIVWLLALISLQMVIWQAPKIVANGWIKNAYIAGVLTANGEWGGYEFLVGVLPIIAVWFWHRRQWSWWQRTSCALILSTIFIQLMIYVYPSHIERHTQRTVIEFYKSKRLETDHFLPLGYKSFAHLFYGRRKKMDQQHQSRVEYREKLLSPYNKTLVYFVARADKFKQILAKYPHLQVINQQNGFIFLRGGGIDNNTTELFQTNSYPYSSYSPQKSALFLPSVLQKRP